MSKIILVTIKIILQTIIMYLVLNEYGLGLSGVKFNSSRRVMIEAQLVKHELDSFWSINLIFY